MQIEKWITTILKKTIQILTIYYSLQQQLLYQQLVRQLAQQQEKHQLAQQQQQQQHLHQELTTMKIISKKTILIWMMSMCG